MYVSESQGRLLYHIQMMLRTQNRLLDDKVCSFSTHTRTRPGILADVSTPDGCCMASWV